MIRRSKSGTERSHERNDHKMKKTFYVLLAIALVTVFLASCSAPDYASDPPRNAVPYANTGDDSYTQPSSESSYGGATDGEAGAATSVTARNTGSGIVPVTQPFSDGALAEKIIYTVNAEIETLEYEATIEGVYQMLSSNSAFIESSHVGGIKLEYSYYGVVTLREAQFSLRIPKERLNAVTASLDDLGNVMNLRTEADNITQQFSDSQSRLNSLRTQEERLLDMLSKADTIEEMLKIEDMLAEIRYKIEGHTSSLDSWQKHVDYSTMNLYISEVRVFTEVEEIEEQELSYWQELGEGFMETSKGVAEFFMSLFKWIVVNLPVLVILAAIAAVIIILFRRKLRRDRKNRKARVYATSSSPYYNTGAPQTYDAGVHQAYDAGVQQIYDAGTPQTYDTSTLQGDNTGVTQVDNTEAPQVVDAEVQQIVDADEEKEDTDTLI